MFPREKNHLEYIATTLASVTKMIEELKATNEKRCNEYLVKRITLTKSEIERVNASLKENGYRNLNDFIRKVFDLPYRSSDEDEDQWLKMFK